MMELIPMTAPHAVGVRISGTIEKDDMLKAIEGLKAVMAAHDDVHIYVELADYGGFSWDAFWADLSFALPNLRHFTRKAVVSDKDWVETLVHYGDKLFSSIEVRHFAPDEEADAKKWIEE